MISRRLLFLATVASTVLVSAPAHAHVEPTVEEVTAGAASEVGFVPEHDCDGSPTVRVDIQSPDSVTDPTPVDQEGWTSSVDGQVVTYEWEGNGGEAPEGFAVSFTTPNLPGETLLFPTIQTCAEGSIDWIQSEPDGDRPAPRVQVIEGDGTQSTTPDTTGPSPSDSSSETTDGSATTTEVPVPTEDDSDDGSNTGLYVAIAAVVVAAGAGGAVYLRRRSQG